MGTLRGWRPISFRRKETGERKGGEGNFSFPSPLPSKRAAFYGDAQFCGCKLMVLSMVPSFDIDVTCLAEQYNTVLIGTRVGFLLRQACAIPPQVNSSREAPWGSAEGGIPPLRFSFPPLSLAKKVVLPPSRRPARRAQKPPPLRLALLRGRGAPSLEYAHPGSKIGAHPLHNQSPPPHTGHSSHSPGGPYPGYKSRRWIRFRQSGRT